MIISRDKLNLYYWHYSAAVVNLVLLMFWLTYTLFFSCQVEAFEYNFIDPSEQTLVAVLKIHFTRD